MGGQDRVDVLTAQRAATRLAAGRLERQRLDRLPAAIRPADEAHAYEVQDRLHEILTTAGFGAIVGHKIGCTTPVMQAFLGIDSPCAGAIFGTTVHRSEATVRHSDFLHVGVECEIAVRIDADLPASGAPYDRTSVAHAVGALMPAIEIVDDRYVDYKRMDTPTLIADDFFNAGCVLGDPLTDWRELDVSALVGTTRINDREVGGGCGRDVMGHPFAALAWLANSLVQRGKHLARGEFVLTGSVVETKWVAAGDRVTVSVDGLGEVRANFTVEAGR